MRIRLTRKFSKFINGVDLTHRRVGEIIELPRHEAAILLAEEWAAPADDPSIRATADDARRRRRSRKRPTK
jgi:hypothetical protein